LQKEVDTCFIIVLTNTSSSYLSSVDVCVITQFFISDLHRRSELILVVLCNVGRGIRTLSRKWRYFVSPKILLCFRIRVAYLLFV